MPAHHCADHKEPQKTKQTAFPSARPEFALQWTWTAEHMVLVMCDWTHSYCPITYVTVRVPWAPTFLGSGFCREELKPSLTSSLLGLSCLPWMRVKRDICHCRWHWLSETIASLRKDEENVLSCSHGSVPGVIVTREGIFQVRSEGRAWDRLGSSRPIHQVLASLPLGRTYILSQGCSELYS